MTDAPPPAPIEAVGAGRPAPPEGRPYHPAVSATLSALLLWFAYPPADRGYLAWVALVPLLLLVRRDDRPRRIYLGAWAGGLVFWLLAVVWVCQADDSAWVAWVALATALSAWWPASLYLARLGVRRLGLPLMAAAPITWVALEYARAYVLTGFPWYYLAHSQYRFAPIVQVADFAGAWGVSLLVVLVNAWVADLLALPLLRRASPGAARIPRAQWARGVVALGAVGLSIGYGAYRLSTARFRPGPRVAAIQTNEVQAYKMGRDLDGLLRNLSGLVLSASRAEPRPDLVVWPETSFPLGVTTIDPALAEADFAVQADKIYADSTPAIHRRERDETDKILRGIADSTGVAQLVGSSEYEFAPGGPFRFNASVLVEPGRAAFQHYRKRHLVPFGEYLPFRRSMPWLVVFTPYEPDRLPSLDPGAGSAPMVLGSGLSLSAAICFEDTIPDVVRDGFSAGPGRRQPDVLVNQSNDGWFAGASEHEAHLAIATFRAVENRVPIVRSTNRGVTAFIDGNGAILASIPKLRSGVLTRVVPLDDRVAPYARWGDWLPLTCLAVTIGLIPQAYLRRRGKVDLPILA